MSRQERACGQPTARAARRCAAAIAVGRVLLGVAAVALPRLLARPWVGEHAAGTAAVTVLARALGGRDIALGAGALRALRGACSGDAAAVPWIAAGACADAVDALATVVGGHALPRRGRTQVTLLAAGAAVVGSCAARVLTRR